MEAKTPTCPDVDMPPTTPNSRAKTGTVTDARLKNAAPGDKPYRIAVGEGLYLEVMPTGSKLWRLKYRIGGKENRFALGAYPNLLLKQARKEADAARELIKAGVHPSHEKTLTKIKRGQDRANTFSAIADEWLALKDWEQSTKGRCLDMLERVVFPTIGKLPVRQITPAHILAILKNTLKDNGPSVAAQARRAMSGVFDLAVATLRADTDPGYSVRKALPKNKTQHKRPLSTEEIGRLLRDLETHGGNVQTVIAFRLMWLTLARPSEVIEARWSEFDLDAATWRIPAERMKKRIEHLIPLPVQAVTVLRGLATITGDRELVFPHRDDKTRPMTTATFRQMLNVLGWAGKYSPHATRTTGSTRLNSMGFPSDWVERQLAHKDPDQVRRTYNHAKHFDGRAKMMQQWADLLDAWKRGDNKVTPLHAAA